MKKYILHDDGQIEECDDLDQWGVWFENANRVIGKTDLPDGTQVSTVFLGLDHSFNGGVPILFETMIFGGPLDQDMARYATLEEALGGHALMVEKATNAS